MWLLVNSFIFFYFVFIILYGVRLNLQYVLFLRSNYGTEAWCEKLDSFSITIWVLYQCMSVALVVVLHVSVH